MRRGFRIYLYMFGVLILIVVGIAAVVSVDDRRSAEKQIGDRIWPSGEKIKIYAPGNLPTSINAAPGQLTVKWAGHELAVSDHKLSVDGKERSAGEFQELAIHLKLDGSVETSATPKAGAAR